MLYLQADILAAKNSDVNTPDFQLAMRSAQKAVALRPSLGAAHGVLAKLYMQSEKYPEAIYCPIETSGDGAVNVYSRVQMMLFKARLAAKEEYQKTLEAANLDVDALKQKMQKSWWKRSALYYPKHGTVAAMSSNVVQEVAHH